jgi:predicted RNA-binding protein
LSVFAGVPPGTPPEKLGLDGRMQSMKTTEKVSDKAGAVRPYVERALTDEELRDNVKSAYRAAREIYDELLGGRTATAVATKVATDKDIQENLRTAVEELRHAAKRVQGKEAHKSRHTFLLMAGITLGVLFNPATGPKTRQWIKDTILGSDDSSDFHGSNGSSTSPSAAA